MTDDRLCSLLERLPGVRRDLVERMLAPVEHEPDRRIPDGLPLVAEVQGAIAAIEAVQAVKGGLLAPAGLA